MIASLFARAMALPRVLFQTALPRVLFFALGLFLLSIPAQAQTGVFEDSVFISAHYTKTERMIPVRDGIKLFTAIYAPKDQSKPYPFLLIRTPYSCAPYGEDQYSDRLTQYIHLVREGYILVFQDVRGRYMSEGDFVDVRPHNPKKTGNATDESSDTYDTVDWLLENVPNNNGRVGIFGISYPGFYASASLPDAHPAVKAVSPQAPVTDWFIGDDFHHNGAFMLMDAFSFYYSFGQPRPKPTTESSPRFEFPTQDNYKYYLEMGALKNFTNKYMNGVGFWKDLMSHPNLDEFWKARNIRAHLKNVKPAVLTVGGLFDAEDCFGAWATYQAIEKQNPGADNRIVMGPWVHGGWSRETGKRLGNVDFGSRVSVYYRQNIELPFFNYYLKDKGKADLPEALVFATGANEWKRYDAWPPRNATARNLYFQANGKLSFDAPTAKESYDECVSDPARPVPYTEDVHLQRTAEYMDDDQRFAARRPDVMVYQTDVLTEDMTLAGPLNADLFVSTTGTDADYVVKLIDVFPDGTPADPESAVPMSGYQMLVRGEIMRGRFRNSFEKPEAMKPGKVERVPFTLPDVCHMFKKGHRIMVQVQYSWFPIADRNPQQFVDIYNCSDSDFIKATQRVYHDAARPSKIGVLVGQ
ncbi:MAG: CocE/NonD family hydrolase [Saprospiraceae bacterium]|nr:CocE/NonD family hydrolase [Saprospiraceae bacterium]MDZ4704748.1 CocE/NonD family hydrolase [Saprospiraceae bacterium]